jgi:type II secretory pathway component GspD/PulD (secretin)
MKKDFVARTSLTSVLSAMILMVAVSSVYPLERGLNDSEIIIGSGLISANLRDAPISNVLEAIEQQAKIQFSMDENLSGEKITVSFQEIPVEHALKRILNSLNYSLIYDQNNEPPRRKRTGYLVLVQGLVIF